MHMHMHMHMHTCELVQLCLLTFHIDTQLIIKDARTHPHFMVRHHLPEVVDSGEERSLGSNHVWRARPKLANPILDAQSWHVCVREHARKCMHVCVCV